MTIHLSGKNGNLTNAKEALLFSAYFALYVTYLFFNQENEIMHWISLVFVPALLLLMSQRYSGQSKWSVKYMLSSVGISKTNARNGIILAVVLGFAFGLLQLLLSDKKQEILNQISSGKVLIAFPLAFVFMFLTAGFTEEFFFRGVLQTRIVRATSSKLTGVLITAIMFGLYHLPYAYFSPNWPSQGNLGEALYTVLTEACLAGIILGWLYEKTNNNLLACIIMHSLFNAMPAMAMLKM